MTKENFSANLLELLTATLGWQVEKKSNGMMVISGVRLRTNGDSDHLTVEEQLQGGLSETVQGDVQGDLKALSSLAQGDQGDQKGLVNQIKELSRWA